MRHVAARVYYGLCLGLGRVLRSARYATVSVDRGQVRKRRAAYAPLLIALSVPLIKALDGGVRVLPRRAWEARERAVSERLRGASVGVDGGTLVLPYLPGKSLAAWLEDPGLTGPARRDVIARAVAALAALHAAGITHADAMAENVLVEPGADVAHWVDFETVHDPRRSEAWRRADDLRALLASCLLRTAPEELEATLRFILDAYPAHDVRAGAVSSFASVWRRPLALHLVQAALPFHRFREIGRLLEVL